MTNQNKQTLNQLEELAKKLAEAGAKWDAQVIVELFKEYEIELDDLIIEKSHDERELITNKGDFRILTDREADKEAYEQVLAIYEDIGLSQFNVSHFHYLDERVLEEMMEDDLQYYYESLSDEELEEKFEQMGVDCIDDLIEKIMDNTSPEEHFLEIYPDEAFLEIAEEAGAVLVDVLIEDVICYNGRGHALSFYDGVETEITTETGTLYAYRIG